jgi:predicted membrane protein
VIEDTLSSFKEVIRDRFRNKFLGAFILGWLTLNWKIPVLIVKSALPIETTIQTIDSQHLSVCRSLLLPILFAAIYVLVSPWLSHVVFLYQCWVDQRRIRAKQKQELYVLEGKQKLVEKEAELEIAKRSKQAVFEHNLKFEQWREDQGRKRQERRLDESLELDKVEHDYQVKERRILREKELRKKFPDWDRSSGEAPKTS